METDSVIREQLFDLLHDGNAHMPFNEAVANFPADAMNDRAPNVSYTPWHLLEHIRLTQRDILDFIRDPDYRSPAWPDGYWPNPDERATSEKWTETIQRFRADLAELEKMVRDPNVSLTASIPHAPGYTILREILLVGDHNAYHIGEFAILRQVMGTWPPGRDR